MVWRIGHFRFDRVRDGHSIHYSSDLYPSCSVSPRRFRKIVIDHDTLLGKPAVVNETAKLGDTEASIALPTAQVNAVGVHVVRIGAAAQERRSCLDTRRRYAKTVRRIPSKLGTDIRLPSRVSAWHRVRLERFGDRLPIPCRDLSAGFRSTQSNLLDGWLAGDCHSDSS
jgi:hypothetical protein